MFVLIFIILALVFPLKTSAQIPLFHRLIAAYQPRSLLLGSFDLLPPSLIAQNLISPTLPLSTAVLGVSTTSFSSNPLPIGGDGRIFTIVVLGDSMIDTLNSNIPSLEKALATHYPDKKFRIINYGVGASDIEYGLFRLQNDHQYQGKNYPSLLSLKPDLIVVESFAYNNFGNTSEGYNRHWLALGSITTTIKNELPNCQILLAATIAPNSSIFANGVTGVKYSPMEKIEKTNTIKLYLQKLVNFANSQNFPLADAYHPSLINNEGNRQFINTKDNIHPSSTGAEFFSTIVAKAIYDHHLIDN